MPNNDGYSLTEYYETGQNNLCTVNTGALRENVVRVITRIEEDGVQQCLLSKTSRHSVSNQIQVRGACPVYSMVEETLLVITSHWEQQGEVHFKEQ